MQTDSDIHHNKSVPLKIGRRVAACGAAKRRRKPQRVPKPSKIAWDADSLSGAEIQICRCSTVLF